MLKDKLTSLFQKMTGGCSKFFAGLVAKISQSTNFSIFFRKIPGILAGGLKFSFQRFVLPYATIFIIAAFVFTTNYVQASESSSQFTPNAEVMDLEPGEVAKVVNAVGAYTPLFQEDAVQVAFAMKDQEFLEKSLITETANTIIVQPNTTRKNTLTYTVDPGDTLSSIGYKYGLKISTIKSNNGLNSDTIKPGQTLKLPPQDINPSVLASGKSVAGASTATAFKGTFGRPTRGWNMSQPFGHTSFERWHTGIDLTSRSGTAILASASGRVAGVYKGWGGGYGNHIIISHGNGFTTLYGHMSQIWVSNGQWVNQGQQIGVMGNTGWSTGTHLHFEIRKNGAAQNPLSYL